MHYADSSEVAAETKGFFKMRIHFDKCTIGNRSQMSKDPPRTKVAHCYSQILISYLGTRIITFNNSFAQKYNKFDRYSMSQFCYLLSSIGHSTSKQSHRISLIPPAIIFLHLCKLNPSTPLLIILSLAQAVIYSSQLKGMKS